MRKAHHFTGIDKEYQTAEACQATKNNRFGLYSCDLRIKNAQSKCLSFYDIDFRRVTPTVPLNLYPKTPAINSCI